MAVAYASSNSASNTTGATLVITKPTGLAEGDLMIAVCGINDKSGDFTPPAGWATLSAAGSGSSFGIEVFWKIATAGDAAASDFSFTHTSDGDEGTVGWIARITGSSFTGTGNMTISLDVNTSGATGHTFTPGVTPLSADALYLIGSFARGSCTQSAYAVTNNNPSWTERVDIAAGGTFPASLSLATALATNIAASGDFTLTLSSSLEAIGFLLSVEETTNVSPSVSVFSAIFSVIAPVVAGAANMTAGVLSAAFNVIAPTVSSPASDWSNQDKSSTSTFSNQDKS